MILILGLAKDDINYETARLDRRLKAVHVSEKITIDGRLDEPVWADAPLAAGFIQSEPKEGQPSSERTEVRVLYDNQNLYVGVFAHDSGVAHLVISDLKKDFATEANDTFDLVLDTFHDQRNGYVFATNAAGAKADSQMINEGRETNSSWDAVWYVKTTVVDDGWIAEMAIPFKSLKFREAAVQTWGLNFHRNLRSSVRNEDSYWSPIPRQFNLQRVSLAGTLEELEGIKPGSNIRLKPYITSSFAQNGSTGVRKGDGDMGFDVKYGITSGLTWDFTYNTDFSQVEADEQQINLTRFNLFFPEKREFFLENSGIFKFGGGDPGPGGGGGGGGAGGGGAGTSGRINSVSNDVFFFSRNIGFANNQAIPVLGGTRLSGRAGAYEIGFLNMQQREYGNIHATNFTIGRLKHNIFANSDVGVMIMNKEVQDSSRFNRVYGTDANLRFGQAAAVNAFVAKATSPGIDSDNLEERLSAAYQGRTWTMKSSYTNVQSNFVNEMGYVPRPGTQRLFSEVRPNFRPRRNKLVRSVSPHVVLDYLMDRHGNLDSKYIDYHLAVTFQNGAWIEIGRNPTAEVIPKSFTLNNGKVVVPAGAYNYYDYFVAFRPDSSRRLQTPSGRWGAGPFYGGYKHTYTLSETLRVNHQFNTSLSYTHNNISIPGGRFRTNLLTSRVNYSFTTSMFLNALVQYNSDSRQWSSNVRFNIIHRPLSDFFLVYNERRNSVTGDLLDRAIIAKLTYMIAR